MFTESVISVRGWCNKCLLGNTWNKPPATDQSDHSISLKYGINIYTILPLYYNEILQSDWSVLDCLFHILPTNTYYTHCEHLLHLLQTLITPVANTYYTSLIPRLLAAWVATVARREPGTHCMHMREKMGR